jgi:hypothetical protein
MISGPCEASRPRMLTRTLVLVFASVFGFSTAFYPLLSVVLLYAATTGAGGARLATQTSTPAAAWLRSGRKPEEKYS